LDQSSSKIQSQYDWRRYSLLALLIFTIDKIIVSIINIRGGPYNILGFYIFDLTTLIFNWIMPLFIVFGIEKQGLSSLGFRVQPSRRILYAFLAFISLVLPFVFFGYSIGLLVELFEQLAFIGFPEEFFYRGYMMGRLRKWLGDYEALLLNALVFSLAHLVFLFTIHDFTFLWNDMLVGFQSFIGGLLLGYIYLKSGDIIPSTLLHVTINILLA
jgi:membrane protease YdiL (CAAX protease family)